MNWLQEEDLKKFKSVGENVLISKDALIFGHNNIEIGSNVRIDAFNIIQAENGWMKIGSCVHLAARSSYVCGGGIDIKDAAQVATGCSLISVSDDFSGEFLVGPTFPIEKRKLTKGTITLWHGSVVGAHSVLLPGTIVQFGAAIGAMSLAKGVIAKDTIYTGVPAKPKAMRSREWIKKLEELEGKDI